MIVAGYLVWQPLFVWPTVNICWKLCKIKWNDDSLFWCRFTWAAREAGWMWAPRSPLQPIRALQPCHHGYRQPIRWGQQFRCWCGEGLLRWWGHSKQDSCSRFISAFFPFGTLSRLKSCFFNSVIWSVMSVMVINNLLVYLSLNYGKMFSPFDQVEKSSFCRIFILLFP